MQPWIDVEVRITSGSYGKLDAVVKHVRPDSRGSLKLAVYVPQLFCTLEVNVFTVKETRYVAISLCCLQLIDLFFCLEWDNYSSTTSLFNPIN